MSSLRVGVVFGGRSVEHEVSVITAHEVIAVLSQTNTVVPLYISKAGSWYTGDLLLSLASYRDIDRLVRQATWVTPVIDAARPGLLQRAPSRRGLLRRDEPEELRIDVALPLVHGTHGEDGTLAALFEMWGVAYAGCGVTAGALSMDKPLAKRVFRAAGIPVLDDLVVGRERWRRDRLGVVAEIEASIGYPAFVKPATLGSSVAVSRADEEDSLLDSVDLAMVYDTRVMIEPAQTDIIEINCSVLGRGDAVRASTLEQPVAAGVLSYEDKYARGAKGGAKSALTSGAGTAAKAGAGMQNQSRLIPAPIDAELARRICRLAMDAFTAIGAAGVARIDFLVRPARGEVILNEINTVPGALSYYLWEPAGLGFAELLQELLQLAQAAAAERRETQSSIEPWLLNLATGGSKRSSS